MTRIRPMFDKETLDKNLCEKSYIASDTVIEIEGKSSSKELFKCHKVFGERSTQEEVFKPLIPLLRYAIWGDNATIFAFGQTGSGKSFTF